MLAQAILKTSLVLWLVQNTIQGGVRPQTGALGRLGQSRAAGILGARAYGVGKPGKTAAAGRYLGVGDYRPTGITGGLKQGYGALGYGGNFGTGLGASHAGAGQGFGRGYGLGNGLGAALGYQGGRGYTGNGYGAPLGYGVGGYHGAGRGYGAPAGTPTGQRPKPSKLVGVSKFTGVGPRVGQSMSQTERGKGYGHGAAGYLGTGLPDGYGAAGLAAGGYPQGVRGGKQIGYGNGFGSEMYGAADGYGAGLGAAGLGHAGLGAAGLGAAGFGGQGLLANGGLGADAKSRKYGAGEVLGAAGSLPYGGQPVVSAGLGPQGKTGNYGGTTFGEIPTLGPDTGLGGAGALDTLVAGGGVGQLPYRAPVIAAGLDGDAGYPYGAEQLSLGADVAKTAAKFGGAGGYGAAAGYGAALSTGSQGAYAGQKDGSKSTLSGVYGNGYRG
ncbi:fibroin heavy chain isoform X3 [Triplophysa dalaica]|uniref:fibroin heavy chain isoform X3 n=1 Tax=Triplophysa dalaica TaxID=1582913 RepID=UPI0024DFA149|nr:fibroin heavy chain isoform X3 [Triplophysa dalaica]